MSTDTENNNQKTIRIFKSSTNLTPIEETPERNQNELLNPYNNNANTNDNLETNINLESMTKSEFNLLKIKKELTDIKEKENITQNNVKPFKNMDDEFIEDKKQENVERIIKKWLSLQKTIKEEITLEDVIIHQQTSDKKSLKDFFKSFYDKRLKKRKIFEDIYELNINNKDYLSLPSFYIQENENSLKDTCEPIKNLLFLFRNNYDYILRMLSLINKNDFNENRKKIYSIVELFNNQFYENILLPNPEQQELLILVYKLLEEEIILMGAASPDDFLNNDSFLGIFLSSYSKRQEIIGYISMILNPIILSIDNEDRECLDLSLSSIKRFLYNKDKEKDKEKDKGKGKDIKYDKSKFSKKPKDEEKNYFQHPRALKEFLFGNIPKTKIKFKNNFELEAEKEKEENEVKNCNTFSKDDNEMRNLQQKFIQQKKMRRTFTEKINFSFNNDVDYNREYLQEINKETLFKKIKDQEDNDLKEFFIKQIENINNDTKKYSNEGLLKIFENEKNSDLIETYKENFFFIRQIIENLIQTIVDKIITLPYSLRCICKIIYLLISKKFPYLSTYSINTFVGKFILNKCIFPVLGLKIKNVLDTRIFSQKTRNCLDTIIDVLAKANSGKLYNTYTDPEKTIFNQYLIEIVPILNKFYEKIIDVQLPKLLDDLVNETSKKMEENNSRKLFNFRHKKKEVKEEGDIPKTPDNNQMPPPLYDYFKENPDEILHLQGICFCAEDILFLTDLIGRNIEKFSDLPKYNFFCKTYKRIKGENQLLKNLINEEGDSPDKPTKKPFFVIFREEIDDKLGKVLEKKKKDRSTFESSEQDSDLICKRIKYCIKRILKGLNLLNNKDFAYLNFAKSTDKFFSALKYTLDEIGEYSELSKTIPLKWYAQYIYNYKNELSDSYQKNDFSKLYEEIYREETNILNELKSLSSIVITRDGMNLRCAEKIIEKAEYELKIIEETKKFIQIEKFIDTEKIEVCLVPNEEFINKQRANIPELPIPVFMYDIKNCIHNGNTNEKIKNHLYYIRDFISIFSSRIETKDKHLKLKFNKIFKTDIVVGEKKYHSKLIFEKYMEYVKKQIKEPSNKKYFGEIKDSDVKEILEKIENHILRHIHKYINPNRPTEKDIEFYKATRKLEWIKPEHLEIKKLYVNQLKFAEKYIKKIDNAYSVYDKLDCIISTYVTMNNTIKFISGKNEDAGQDELTPLFQYILIKAQPEYLFTNINYIKSLINEADLIGSKGFYVSQMESSASFINNISYKDLKIDKNEFDAKIKTALEKYNREKAENNKLKNEMNKRTKNFYF